MNNLRQCDVAFVISKNYIGQYKVTFNSLKNSNPDLKFRVHLFHGDLDGEDIDDLTAFSNGAGAEIQYYRIDDAMFAGLPKMHGDNSYSAYYKVLIPYCTQNLEKLLFLDCDIIVRGSIRPLFEEQSNTFLSAASDFMTNKKRKDHIKKIVGDENAVYFNSGVMLFDFSHADQMVPKESVLGYIAANADIIRWHDQDILNHFYAKNYTLLDEKYNYLTIYKGIGDMLFRFGKKKAVVVHYANWKPWRSNYIGKCYRLYKKNYLLLKGEKGVDFMVKRSFGAQLKLIFKYIFKR